MVRRALAASILALGLAGSATSADFVTPSRNIACAFFSGSLRCDILSGLRPEPSARCELDWTGITLLRSGRARATCAGDTVFDPGARTLAYGETWRRGGITCSASRIGLRCTSRSGHGFFLARERWRLF